MSHELYVALSIGCIAGAVLCALFLIIVVLVQPGNSSGISALGGNTDTFYNKSKSKTLESKLRKLTFICLTLLAIFMIVFYVVAII